MRRGRRFVLAAISLMLAAMLFHKQLAEALVSRGDDFLYRGDAVTARTYYARALDVDHTSQSAADRFVFFSLQQRTVRSLELGVVVATQYLERVPRDATILEDRALCYQLQKRFRLAEMDFERAAQLTKDARYYTFAGWAAKRDGKNAAAIRLWVAALRVDPHFWPARRALRSNAS
ncbi:MAG: tetratricopeptide repeat protein [Vulcanimicrobiaceae bacterium]